MSNSRHHTEHRYIDSIHRKPSRMYLILTTHITHRFIFEIHKHFNSPMNDNSLDELDLTNEVTPAELAQMSHLARASRSAQLQTMQTMHPGRVHTDQTGFIGWLMQKRIVKSPESAIRVLLYMSLLVFILSIVAYVAILRIGQPRVDEKKYQEALEKVDMFMKSRELQRR